MDNSLLLNVLSCERKKKHFLLFIRVIFRNWVVPMSCYLWFVYFFSPLFGLRKCEFHLLNSEFEIEICPPKHLDLVTEVKKCYSLDKPLVCSAEVRKQTYDLWRYQSFGLVALACSALWGSQLCFCWNPRRLRCSGHLL